MAERATKERVLAHPDSRALEAASAPGLLRVVLRAVLCLLLAVAVTYWALTAFAILRDPVLGYDFGIYYAAALALRDAPHANVYDLHVIQAAARLHHAPIPTLPYLYPTLLAVLLLPLAALPYPAALALWNASILLLWLGGTALLARWSWRIVAARVTNRMGRTDSGLVAVTLTIFLSLLYGPFWEALHLGQVSVLIFFLALVAPALVRRERPHLAGALLALAAAIKLFPIVLLGYYVLRGKWRVLRGALVATVALAALVLLATAGSGLAMQRDLPAAVATDTVLYQNQSLAWVPRWIALEFGATPGALTSLLGYLLIAAVALVFALAIGSTRGTVVRRAAERLATRFPWAAWVMNAAGASTPDAETRGATFAASTSASAPAVEALGYAWALATMVLVSPVTWMHHDTWLLPTFILCFAYSLRAIGEDGSGATTGERKWAAYMLLATVLLGYVLTMNLLPFGYDGVSTPHLGPYISGHPLRPILMLLRPLGTLLLWGAAGALYMRERRLSRIGAAERERAVVAPSPRMLAMMLACLVATMIALWTLLLPIWYA